MKIRYCYQAVSSKQNDIFSHLSVVLLYEHITHTENEYLSGLLYIF